MNHELNDMLSFFDISDYSILSQHMDAAGRLASVPLSSTSLDASSYAAPKHDQSGTSSPVTTYITNDMGVPYCGLLGLSTQSYQGHPYAGLLLDQNGAVLGAVPDRTPAVPEYSFDSPQAPAPRGAKGKLTLSC